MRIGQAQFDLSGLIHYVGAYYVRGTMKILMAGDIVGSPGRRAFEAVIARKKADNDVDFVVVNAENSAGGKGLTMKIADSLFRAGADMITLGDHAWNQRDFMKDIDQESRIVRPANFAPGHPGSGIVTVQSDWGPITVINLIGRVFLKPMDCPFRKADKLLRKDGLGKVILVDFHAEATSEKVAMGHYLNGRVSAVVGTHTHVQTSDGYVLSKGTAYQTDLGMTGPRDSVIGCKKDAILQSFLTGLPVRFEVASDDVFVEGAIIDVDEATGRARSIQAFREAL